MEPLSKIPRLVEAPPEQVPESIKVETTTTSAADSTTPADDPATMPKTSPPTTTTDAQAAATVTTGESKRMVTHTKCRSGKYSGSDVERANVPADKVSWTVDYPEYKPVEYTFAKILKDKPDWADPHDDQKEFHEIKFNCVHANIDRTSFTGKYELVKSINETKRPRNPVGRTGISGRGLLGKWGPNHAADPIVTRWKRNENGEKVTMSETDKRPILEFVSIQRKDNHEWAIPGGMVDNGELISLTLQREFGEEALNSLEESDRAETKNLIDELFSNGKDIYKGYVDDPRNTDNSWMETVAVNFHDEEGTNVGKIPLQAGDDAKSVTWLSIDKELNLYASHFDFIKKTCENRGAFFPSS